MVLCFVLWLVLSVYFFAGLLVFACVRVVFVFLLCFFVVFWLLLLFGRFCVWLVWLGFGLFVFFRWFHGRFRVWVRSVLAFGFGLFVLFCFVFNCVGFCLAFCLAS